MPVDKFLLINTGLLPLFYLINRGLSLLIRLFLQKKFNIEFYSQYSIFSAIASAASSFTNVVMLLIFGLIVLFRKTSVNDETITE